MVPTSFDESNVVLNRPQDISADTCEALSVWRGEVPTADGPVPAVISCFKLTKEELAEINKTGRVWLTVMGQTMPPVALAVEKPFK